MTSLPATMTAIGIKAPGGPDVLVPQERPVPAPGPGEILVKVAAAGVNRPDVVQRQGHYPPPPGAPDIPGLEIAGEVVARGADATRWSIGDSVAALVIGGGYAQYCVAHESHAFAVPKGYAMADAAAMPETFLTVWHNVFERGALARGETLLVHGGSSGIGTTAIQLGKAFGARVVVTAGSADKCKACLQIGADAAINYKEQDFVEEVKRLTEGRGVDVVLDMVAGSYIARDVQCLAEDGRIVIIAVQGGVKSEFNAGDVLRRRLTITGSTLRPRPESFKAAIAASLRANVWPLLEAERIKPIVHRVFEASQAAAAHRLMESGEHVGKIVLRW